MRFIRSVIISILVAMFILLTSFENNSHEFKRDFIADKVIKKDSLRFFAVPGKARNYFLFQSIGNSSRIVIGEFVVDAQMISLIIDKGSDGKVDNVIEYFPSDRGYNYPQKPTSKIYTNFEEIKRQIIDGTIFKQNYSFNMSSLPQLKERLRLRRGMYKSRQGYSVKIYDPESPSSIMSEFYFSKKNARYDLVFNTYYYKIAYNRISPFIFISVYCKDSEDPYIKEVVESLFKIISK